MQPTLPPEVVLIIIDLADRPSLLSFARTGAQYLTHCRARIFHDVDLLEHHDDRGKWISRYTTLYQALERNPGLGACARSLHLFLQPFQCSKSSWDAPDWRGIDPNTLPRFLRHFTRIANLTLFHKIQWSRGDFRRCFSDEGVKALSTLTRNTNLRHLQLRDLDRFPLSMLQGCSHLESINLSNVIFARDVDSPLCLEPIWLAVDGALVAQAEDKLLPLLGRTFSRVQHLVLSSGAIFPYRSDGNPPSSLLDLGFSSLTSVVWIAPPSLTESFDDFHLPPTVRALHLDFSRGSPFKPSYLEGAIASLPKSCPVTHLTVTVPASWMYYYSIKGNVGSLSRLEQTLLARFKHIEWRVLFPKHGNAVCGDLRQQGNLRINVARTFVGLHAEQRLSVIEEDAKWRRGFRFDPSEDDIKHLN